MMITTRNILFSFVVLILMFSYSSAEDPGVWIKPKDSSFKAKWRNQSPMLYLTCIGDFNGDGKKDTARIMESLREGGIGIFISLASTGKSYNPICVYNSETGIDTLTNLDADQKAAVQRMYRYSYGIKIVKKGHYKTACGKGFYDCREGEPEEIDLRYPGINFFQYDAGDERYIYWDAKKNKFIIQQMSD